MAARSKHQHHCIPFPRLEPTTVEGAVRAFFRMLAHDDRLLLSTDPQAWDATTVEALTDLKTRLYFHFLQGTRLANGNAELLEDVRRRDRDANTPDAAAQYLFVRLVERAWMERNYYPGTVAHAALILKAELSERERDWLMLEPLTEHGLLMHELVTWCMKRFGLEGANTPLIEELTQQLQLDGYVYHPWLAARYVIQQFVLAALASSPELAEAVMQREIATSMKNRKNTAPNKPRAKKHNKE